MNNFDGYEEPTSRAFWIEDFERNPLEGPNFTVEWVNTNAKPIQSKNLIIITGNILNSIFTISDDYKVCTVNSTTEFNVAALYVLNDLFHVYKVSSSVDLKSAGKFIDEISDVITQSEKIFVFTDENISRLSGEERVNIEKPTLWRSLSTRTGRKVEMSVVPALKSPNFVVGVAAGVIAYAEMLDRPATAYILYVADNASRKEINDTAVELFSKATKFPLEDGKFPRMETSASALNANKFNLYI